MVRLLFLLSLFECHEERERRGKEKERTKESLNFTKIKLNKEKDRKIEKRKSREAVGDVLKYEDRICALIPKIFGLLLLSLLPLSTKILFFNNNTAAATVIHWIHAFVTLFKWIPVL